MKGAGHCSDFQSYRDVLWLKSRKLHLTNALDHSVAGLRRCFLLAVSNSQVSARRLPKLYGLVSAPSGSQRYRTRLQA